MILEILFKSLAGILLIVPGLLTDIFALFLLIKPLQKMLAAQFSLFLWNFLRSNVNFVQNNTHYSGQSSYEFHSRAYNRENDPVFYKKNSSINHEDIIEAECGDISEKIKS